MKLVYLLQHRTWFVEHERAWFRIADDAQAVLAAGALTLDAVDLYELVEQPHQRGTATLADRGTAIEVTLRDTDGKLALEKTVERDERILTHVEWQGRVFRDGWRGSDVELAVSGATRFALWAYLPKAGSAGPKTLWVIDGESGDRRRVTLVRDGQTLCEVFDGHDGSPRRFRLRCEPEPNGSAGDVRSLGFVLVNEELEVA